MRTNLTGFIENNSRRWAFVKFTLFVLTIFAPMLWLSLGTGRLVWIFLLYFPLGLFYFFPTSAFFLMNLAKLVLGWGVYITIVTIGTTSKKFYVFVFAYILLLGLLILNLQGCVSMIVDAPAW